jgi:uncharacterized membrane protein YbhN (UPF0104 family)
MQRKSILIRILSVALVVVACGFIYHLLAEDWGQFLRSIAAVNPRLFGISVALGLLANMVAAYFYVFLLRGHHDLHHWRPLIKIFLISQVVRYVPGKVWSYLYQMSLLPVEVRKTTTVLTNVEMILISMLVVGGAGVLALFWPSFFGIFVVVVCLSAAVSFSYRLGLIDWVLKKLLRPFVRFGVYDLKKRPYNPVEMILVITVWAMLVITSLTVAMHAIWPLSTNESIVYTACLLLSWILSALVFIVPVGIGVRETGFVALSTLVISSLDGGQLAATAIIIRFWQLIIDILSGAIGILVSGETDRDRQ